MFEHMRRAAFAAIVTLLLLGVVSTAQAAPYPYNNNINGTELSNFDRYLDNHPQVAQQLRRNPSLADNPNYLRQHPGLQQFLANHPGVHSQLQQNPHRFMNREHAYDRRTDAWRDRQRINRNNYRDQKHDRDRGRHENSWRGHGNSWR